MLKDVAKSSVVLDREVEKEKSREPSDPRIRCPLCGWSPRKEDQMVLHLRGAVEYIRHGRRLPSLPAPVDYNPVSLVRSLVAALGLVCAVNRDNAYSNGRDSPASVPR
jgi:hypothetical protein